MKKYARFFLLILCLLFIFSGCSRIYLWDKTPPRVVTQIHILRSGESGKQLWQYTTPEKMQTIILYLRLLQPQGQTDIDPERLLGDAYEITLFLSDGNKHIYRQRADRFLSKDAMPWQMIDKERAQSFPRLLQKLPSDQI